MISLVAASAAHAQTGETVVLEEGRTPTPVALGTGNDRVVVDIGRVNADTGILDLTGLTTGPLTDDGGSDTVWLRATSSQTRNVVHTNPSNTTTKRDIRADSATGTPFDGGTVYEASGNDTVLTLENRSRSPIPTDPTKLPNNADMNLRYGPLRLAGDGKAILTFSISSADQPNATQQALRVEAGASAAGGDGKLDVVLDGADVGGNDVALGLIDVQNAASLRLSNNSRVQLRSGTGILGGEADIYLDGGTWLNGYNADISDITLLKSSGRVFNSTKISVGGQFGDADAGGVAVRLEGGKLYNILTESSSGTGTNTTNTGNIIGGANAVLVANGNNVVENVGDIRSFTGAAIRALIATSVVRNNVWSFSKGGATRAGTITGGTIDGRQLAYQGVDSVDFLVNSGTITGDVDLGNKDDMFLYTGANNGVTGEIEGGNGTDGYGKSFSASATHTLNNNILGNGNSGFEMHGIEARGVDTTITVAAPDTLDAGLMLAGNGTIINTANITTHAGYGAWVRKIANVDAGMRFINRGNIRTDGRSFYGQAGLRSFINEGLIHSDENYAAIINLDELGGAIPTFQFQNAGTIESESGFAGAVALQINASAASGPIADIVNSGTIRHLGDRESFYGYPYAAFQINDVSDDADNLYRFMNGGTIEATGRGVSGLTLVGPRIDVTNTQQIRASGMGAGGVGIFTAGDRADVETVARLDNSGSILGNGASWDNDDGTVDLAYGVGFSLDGADSAAELINSGAILAQSQQGRLGGTAIAVVGGDDHTSYFNFTNAVTGQVRGHANTLFGADQHLIGSFSELMSGRVLAGAIHTRFTIDKIENRGSILGDVDLGEMNDIFYAYGSLTGDLRLGTGSDTYVVGSGGTLTGTADGGADFDVIRFDLTGDAAKKINASQFKNFEALAALQGSSGIGKTSVFGTFDAASILVGGGFTLSVDAGDTVASANGATGTTFYGDDGEQRIDNAGTIIGGLSMGAGNDTLTNSGTIGYNVSMGVGDDVVVNSGTITGNLSLGAGNDRYEALGGLVTGTIDGGDGDNDTFVFRMNGDDGSIPGGFINFESFGAYGPGTLTLALNQNYNTIELLERANLTLNDGTGTVGLIKGDDTAQVVTINDADFNGSVSLGGGDDTLSMVLNGTLAGDLDGGAGTDTLNLNLTGDSTINDLFNFEIANVAGTSSLTLEGTLGAGQQINFDDNDNHFIIGTGATFRGKANGGAGTDTIEVNSARADSKTIVAGQLTSFEKLVAGGEGTLELRDEAYSFQSVTAEGNITIGNGASLTSATGVIFNDSNNTLRLEGTGTVNSPVDGGTGTDTLAFALAAGQARNLSSVNVTGFERLAAEGTGMLVVDQSTDNYRSLLLGIGAGSSLAPADGGNATIAQGVTFSGDVDGNDGGNTLTLRSGATIDGEVYMNGGNDTVTNAGTINGNLYLGDGDDRYIAQAGGIVTGTIDGGAGNNTFVFRLDNGNGSIPGSVLNFSSFGAYGPGTLTVNLDAGQTYTNLELLEGANLVLSGTNGAVGNVIGDDSAQSVTIDGALTGGVSLGGGDDSLTMQLSGLLEGSLDGGAGTDTLNLNLTGASSIAGMYGFEIANISGSSPLTLTGDLGADQQVNFTGDVDNELIIAAGVKFEGTVDGGAGRDLLRVQSGAADSRTVVASQIVSFEDLVSEGAGTLALTGGDYAFASVAVNGGNFELGANTKLTSDTGVVFDGADNRFTLGSGATVTGLVDGGAGNDTLALVQGVGTTRLLSSLQATGFETLAASGAGELRIDQNAAFTGGVTLDGGTTSVMQGATLTANVVGGDAGDILNVAGTISGDVDLGAGNDTLMLTGTGNITGTRNGGEGVDRLTFNTGGTYAAPTVYDGTGYTGFEQLGVAGGVVSLTGNSSWTGVAITGGRLIGQAGTTLTSTSAIEVSHGATFGSAGTVNADINVAGTLSPGASPGTMTVNGNVNFAAGSNLLLEVSPTVSDLLNISGKLTIAAGAAIDITGVLHGTPGNMLDLVVAQGGINGQFTTINKSNDIFGFVVQNGNKLQIRSEFLNADGYPFNVQASIEYANRVLRDGYGVQTFTAALPVLVDAQGAINTTAFAQITPEAYGSAIQLGVENSLLVVDGARTMRATTSARDGLYSFGSFVHSSGDVAEQGANTGAARAHLSGNGFFGGVGYGFGTSTQIGVFLGGLDSRQTISGLGARTDMDSFVAGIFADTSLAGFGVHGLLAYNKGDASTRRQMLVSDTAAKSTYGLNSWVADMSLDYQVRFGALAVTPKLGITYVGTHRGTVAEQGGGGFAYALRKDKKDSLFGDAAIAVSGDFKIGGTSITPYAQVGIRQMLNDATVITGGRLIGAGSDIIVAGVERERTMARVELGLGVDISKSVRFQAGYAGEFNSTRRNSVTGGVTVRF